ncbi:MAG: hypothetical protein ACXVKP_17630, partial [Ilumatobacteraceae bacterium]
EAVRKFGQVYAEIKKMSSGFQSELKSALDEPMREMRETAEAFKNAANFDFKFDADEPVAASPPEPDKTPEAVAEPAEAATPEPSNAEGEAIIPVADQDPKVVETVEESANE